MEIENQTVEQNGEEHVTEEAVGVAPEESKEAPQLATRDALERALKEVRGDEEAEKQQAKPQVQEGRPSEAQVKAAVKSDLEPPSEFSKDGKRAWKEGDIAGIQREYKRLHDARTAEVMRAKNAEREALEKSKPYMQMAELAAPYIKARGDEGVAPHQAIMEALALVNSMRGEKPSAIKAELKKIGIDLDGSETESNPEEKQLITSLQEKVDALIQEREQVIVEQTKAVFLDSVQKLAAQKTRTGDPVYPDLYDNSEEGQQFAQAVGLTVRDPSFKKGVLRRFPDADITVLLREAYKYHGGRVSGEPIKEDSISAQNHVQKAKRASAVTPARTAVPSKSQLAGKLSTREALAKALEDLRGE